jgi:hypothetical protein
MGKKTCLKKPYGRKRRTILANNSKLLANNSKLLANNSKLLANIPQETISITLAFTNLAMNSIEPSWCVRSPYE